MIELRRLAALVLVSVMLVACGGGGSSSASQDAVVSQPGTDNPSSDPDPISPDPVDPGAVAARATLTWSAPTQREDGSTLETYEIASYEIYHLVDSDGSMDIITIGGDVTEYALDLVAGNHELGVSVIDIYGVRSQMSELQTVAAN